MDDNQSKNVIRTADERSNIESVVFDRETKTPAIVAKSSNTNSYYPIFLDDNTLAYIDSTKIETWQQKPEFSVKLAMLEKASSSVCPRCFENGTAEEQMAAFLGAIRDKNCEKDPDFYFKNEIPSFSALRSSQCQSLVESCDSKCLDDIKKQIVRVSARGGIVNGVSLKTVQNWNVESIGRFEKKDLSSFCTELVKANAASPNRTTPITTSH